MNFTLLCVGAVSFLAYQLTRYISDVKTGDEGKRLVWHTPSLLFAILVLSLFVGVLVALISQDQSSGESQFYPLPLDFAPATGKEWLRAILLGFGAMPILKKGSLSDLGKIGVQTTPISSGAPTFSFYLRAWWQSQ